MLREDSRGASVTKEHRHSRHRIDATLAAMMALDWVAELAGAAMPAIYL